MDLPVNIARPYAHGQEPWHEATKHGMHHRGLLALRPGQEDALLAGPGRRLAWPAVVSHLPLGHGEVEPGVDSRAHVPHGVDVPGKVTMQKKMPVEVSGHAEDEALVKHSVGELTTKDFGEEAQKALDQVLHRKGSPASPSALRPP